MRRGLNAWRGGDTETLEGLMDEFLAPDFESEPLYFDGTYRGREQLWQLCGSGVPVDQRMWILWRFSGQQAVHAKSFASKAEALEAAGLRE